MILKTCKKIYWASSYKFSFAIKLLVLRRSLCTVNERFASLQLLTRRHTTVCIKIDLQPPAILGSIHVSNISRLIPNRRNYSIQSVQLPRWFSRAAWPFMQSLSFKRQSNCSVLIFRRELDVPMTPKKIIVITEKLYEREIFIFHDNFHVYLWYYETFQVSHESIGRRE